MGGVGRPFRSFVNREVSAGSSRFVSGSSSHARLQARHTGAGWRWASGR